MNKQKSRSSIMLMEIIVTVCLFMICGAICIQFFVNAYLADKKTEDLNSAVLWASSSIEIMKSEDAKGALEKCYALGENVGKAYLVYFDEDRNECKKAAAKYVVEDTIDEGEMITLTSKVYKLDGKDKKLIYELTTQKAVY